MYLEKFKQSYIMNQELRVLINTARQQIQPRIDKSTLIYVTENDVLHEQDH